MCFVEIKGEHNDIKCSTNLTIMVRAIGFDCNKRFFYSQNHVTSPEHSEDCAMPCEELKDLPWTAVK